MDTKTPPILLKHHEKVHPRRQDRASVSLPPLSSHNTNQQRSTKSGIIWSRAPPDIHLPTDQQKKRPYKILQIGATPLMHACQQGNRDRVIRLLREQEATIDYRDRTLRNTLHYCMDAATAGAVASAAPELVNSPDAEGHTPLHLAVIAGDTQLVAVLLANGANVNAKDLEGHSVLHWATVCGEAECVRLVLAAGARPSSPDLRGGSPLHYAAQCCGMVATAELAVPKKVGLKVLKTLLEFGADVDARDEDGRQPLLWAASAGSVDAVLALVRAGGSATAGASDKDGLTALHCAASRGHTRCIESLVNFCGAQPDHVDDNGCSALHYAATLGHADATALLLKLGADPNRQDRKGRTPALCSAAKGQLETLKILAQYGGSLHAVTVRGTGVAHEAAASGRVELIKWIARRKPSLLDNATHEGRTPLHVAALHGHLEICKVLLDHGVRNNVLLRTSKGNLMTPLDSAVYRGHRDCAKLIQMHGGLASQHYRSSRDDKTVAAQFYTTSLESNDSSSPRYNKHRNNNKATKGWPNKRSAGGDHTLLSRRGSRSLSEEDLTSSRHSKRKHERRARSESARYDGFGDGKSMTKKIKFVKNTKDISEDSSSNSDIIQTMTTCKRVTKKKTNNNNRSSSLNNLDNTSDDSSRTLSDDSLEVVVVSKSSTEKIKSGRKKSSRAPRAQQSTTTKTTSSSSSSKVSTRKCINDQEDNNNASTRIMMEKIERESSSTKAETTEEQKTTRYEKKHVKNVKNNNTSQETVEQMTITAIVHRDSTQQQQQQQQHEVSEDESTSSIRGGGDDEIVTSKTLLRKERSSSEKTVVERTEINKVDSKAESAEKPTTPSSRSSPPSISVARSFDETRGEQVMEQQQDIADESSTIERQDGQKSVKRVSINESDADNGERRDSPDDEKLLLRARRMSKRLSLADVGAIGENRRDDSREDKSSSLERKRSDGNSAERSRSSRRMSARRNSFRQTAVDERKSSSDSPPKYFVDGVTLLSVPSPTTTTAEQGRRSSKQSTESSPNSSRRSSKRLSATDNVIDRRKSMAGGRKSICAELPLTTTTTTTGGDSDKEQVDSARGKSIESRGSGSFEAEQQQQQQQQQQLVAAGISDESSKSTTTVHSSILKSINKQTTTRHRENERATDNNSNKLSDSSSSGKRNRAAASRASVSSSTSIKRAMFDSEDGCSPDRSAIVAVIESPEEWLDEEEAQVNGEISRALRVDEGTEDDSAVARMARDSSPGKESSNTLPRMKKHSLIERSNDQVTTMESERVRAHSLHDDRRSLLKASTATANDKQRKDSGGRDSGIEPSPRVSRIPRRSFKCYPNTRKQEALNMDTVTRDVQVNLRKYHLERKIFFQLMELKRLQIRHGRSNEHVLVKRQVESFHKQGMPGPILGIARYDKALTFRDFEAFLYEQLRKLHKRTPPDWCVGPKQCTEKTHRCHHVTSAYTSVPVYTYHYNCNRWQRSKASTESSSKD